MPMLPRHSRSSTIGMLSQLTPAEREVFLDILNGRCNKEITENLGITVRTVRSHASNLLHKLGFENRVELLASLARLQADFQT